MSFTMPTTQEDVGKTMKELREELAQINKQRTLITSLIRAVQEICTHPSSTFDNGWGRMSSTRCDTCGKVW